ncbi:putative peptidase of plants and bacteria [Lyophyllum shimeji]|uniref:Peptidase of plants and bacteria n=1 Tax=Lyophyllum shimeji TaxID=47721 RepID=A0A9P3UTE8_LYOSH|nr:putative peptidase of plants and bacteria [Lyophyllum shimeji]
MPGVAHATGSAHAKEIHFSLDYIAKQSAERARNEIRGVLTHETVHCFQYDAQGTCQGGLIEGIADYVRLRAGLDPPHWKQRGGDEWDAGYETTGYFLAWLEERYGDGTIKELNERMHGVPYDKRIFKETTGRPVKKLWKIYCAHLEEREKKEDSAGTIEPDTSQ